MRVTYIAQTSPPEPGATKRPLEQAKILVSLGHSVTLITALPSYPLGRVFDGYRRRLWMRETIDGVRLVRVWCVPTPNSGVVRRFASYVTFGFAAMIAGLAIGRADVVIGSVPKPFSGLAALLVARARHATFVLELRDLMPDTLKVTGFDTSGLMYRALSRYYAWLYHKVDVFALVYPAMGPTLGSRGASHATMLTLSHATEPTEQPGVRSELMDSLGLEDKFVVTYAGSFNSQYETSVLVDAAELLITTHPRVVVLIIGTGADYAAVERAVKNRNVTNVRLTGGIDPGQVAQYLHASHVFVRPQHLPEFTDGTKIGEYLTMGRPIIDVCIDSTASGTAEQLGVGLSIARGDAPGLADAIRYYADHPAQAQRAGQNAREFACDRFDRRKIVTAFAADLEQAMKRERV